MIQHVTYHLSWDELGYTTLAEIMELIGFQEVEPNDPFEHGYRVRWFRNPQPGTAAVLIHFVADGAAQDLGLGLGHFCVTVVRLPGPRLRLRPDLAGVRQRTPPY
jgi:hypothetical protein